MPLKKAPAFRNTRRRLGGSRTSGISQKVKALWVLNPPAGLAEATGVASSKASALAHAKALVDAQHRFMTKLASVEVTDEVARRNNELAAKALKATEADFLSQYRVSTR